MHFPLKQTLFIRNRSFLAACSLVLSLCLSLAGHAIADEVTHLYEATIPVQNQDKDQRNLAIQAAFLQVLIRVSGRLDVGDTQEFPAIAQATQSATQYAQQFRYEKTDSTDATQQPGLALWVRFDETAISHLLRASHLPVWGMTRPTTLVWLAVDQRGQRELLGADSRNDVYNILTAEATLRGVPVRLPLLDLTDRTSIHTSDIWGNFGNTILQASQRYQTEAVLVGRVYQANAGSWVGNWTLYIDSGSESWAVNDTSLAAVLNAGVDKTAQSLALRYGQVDQADTGNVLVEVKQIRGLADYNRVVKYLKSISHVKDVQPVELAASSAVFQVRIPGGRLAVARAVSLSQVLASDETASVPIESLGTETAATNTNTTVAATTNPVMTSGTVTTATAATTTTAATVKPDPGKVIPDLTYRLLQ